MSKQFWIFLIVGLGIVGVLISGVFMGTKSSHLELTGKILKVRTLALSGGKASLVVIDFRVKNPSAVPFVVSNVEIRLEPSSGTGAGAEITGSEVSKADIASVFEQDKLIGPQFNDVLTLQSRIPPQTTQDRMVGARFELPESAIGQRKSIRLHIEDVDGTAAEIGE